MKNPYKAVSSCIDNIHIKAYVFLNLDEVVESGKRVCITFRV
jgi:hypothetical protein